MSGDYYERENINGVAMSYSPPGSEKARKRNYQKWSNENEDPRHNLPLQQDHAHHLQKKTRAK